MKNYLLITLLLFTHTCLGNAIDKIKTKLDVIRFLDKYLPDTVYHESRDWIFFHPDFRRPTDSFYIIDFDKNGRNDLIVDGAEMFIVFNTGKNIFKEVPVYGDRYRFKGIRKTDSANHLIVAVEERAVNGFKHLFDTALIYKWNSLVEYSPVVEHQAINSVELKHMPGFGGKALLKRAVIHADGRATFYYRNSTTSNHLKKTMSLPAGSITDLWDLVNYMGFEKLPDDDGGEVMDFGKTTLKVDYTNGKKKLTKISHKYNPNALFTLISIIENHFKNIPSSTGAPLTSEEENELEEM